MSNQSTQQFSPTVSDRLGYYVYRLIDPRNGETFYIGKGKGNRVFEHARGALELNAKDNPDDEESAKFSRIQDIRNAHLEVLHIIHRHGLAEDIALQVEAALIDAYPGVTNAQGGHGSSDLGPMHAEEIIKKYDLPTVTPDPNHRLLLINVNHIVNRENPEAILKQTQFAWRLSLDRAEAVDYVLAVERGIVIGVFVPEKWLAATTENFPQLGGESIPKRFGFRGKPAPQEIWDHYVGPRGKRIDRDDMRHIQNPIRYWPNDSTADDRSD